MRHLNFHTCISSNMHCSRRCSFVRFDMRLLLMFHKTEFLRIKKCLIIHIDWNNDQVSQAKEEIKKREDKIVLDRIIRRRFFPKEKNVPAFFDIKGNVFYDTKIKQIWNICYIQNIDLGFHKCLSVPKFSLTLYAQNCSQRTRHLSRYCTFPHFPHYCTCPCSILLYTIN